MILLIPGPVTTRSEVRAAMAQDLAPWDLDFRALTAGVRARLLAIAGGTPGTHAALALQGCGHFATEAAIRTFVPARAEGGGRLLVPMTGHYAERMVQLARAAGREVVELPVGMDSPVPLAALRAALAADPEISHVGLVYSETSSGMIHDPAPVAAAAQAAGRRMLLDAVSAFGALPLDVASLPALDCVVFTANKCLEAMPGMAFAVAPIERLEACAGNAGSWSFDFADVYAHTKRAGPGTFRFTPAAQSLAALSVALDLFDAEGGRPARLARYAANADALHAGFTALGLAPMLPRALQGPIVMNVAAPADAAWNLQAFVDGLKGRGFLISNFFNTDAPSFRVGLIGAVGPADMQAFLHAADATLAAMGVRTRAPLKAAA